MTSPSPTEDLIFEARSVTKRYPGQTALDDVTFRVRRGAVNVLIGENGAGKSTLMRILAGVEQSDAGELLLNGQAIAMRTPRDAARHGIGIVHQELALLPNLDVTENIFAGRELLRSLRWIDRPREDVHSSAALQQLNNPLPVRMQVAQLSLGRRQIVELARTMAHGARILILDEPTSALSSAEAESLFNVIADLKSKGCTLIYISHRLHELLYLGDHFTVLRGGKVVGEAARSEVDRTWIVERMSGRTLTEGDTSLRANSKVETLAVRDLCTVGTEGDGGLSPLHDISLTLARGEIVGVYGLLGSGRTELMESLAGSRAFTGDVRLNGKPVALHSVHEAVDAGIVMVPEDRQRDGLVPDLSIRENVMLGARGFYISRASEAERVRALATDLNLRAPDLELPVTTLSGGNQQKVLLARCLVGKPQVLLLDEPTRGVDVRAKAEIYSILRRLAEQGLAILFTSSEIEETRLLADRVLVLRQGTIGAEFTRDELTDEALFAAASPRVAREMVQ